MSIFAWYSNHNGNMLLSKLYLLNYSIFFSFRPQISDLEPDLKKVYCKLWYWHSTVLQLMYENNFDQYLCSYFKSVRIVWFTLTRFFSHCLTKYFFVTQIMYFVCLFMLLTTTFHSKFELKILDCRSVYLYSND